MKCSVCIVGLCLCWLINGGFFDVLIDCGVVVVGVVFWWC